MAEVINITPGCAVWVPGRRVRFDGYILDVMETNYKPGEYITTLSSDKIPEELLW